MIMVEVEAGGLQSGLRLSPPTQACQNKGQSTERPLAETICQGKRRPASLGTNPATASPAPAGVCTGEESEQMGQWLGFYQPGAESLCAGSVTEKGATPIALFSTVATSYMG